ncbi:MAG: hypothetical protein NZ899_10270 [Thermoguttaceae bacterium]|nr:hypothetical protein [Thermoguttaceae bacterium]MDW8078209.1 hypothetical protein [Thermoguttaceae bacterium]
MGAAWVDGWRVEKTPRDFGLVRSRWTCAVLALKSGIAVSAEAVRPQLHRPGFRGRRPRPLLVRCGPAKGEPVHCRGL